MSEFNRIYRTDNDVSINDVRIVDGEGDRVGTESNRFEVESRNEETYTIFSNMLREMKKTNIHLSIISDNYISNSDVEI